MKTNKVETNFYNWLEDRLLQYVGSSECLFGAEIHDFLDRTCKKIERMIEIEVIGEDIDLTPLAPLPNIQRTAYGQNIEKNTARSKLRELFRGGRIDESQ